MLKQLTRAMSHGAVLVPLLVSAAASAQVAPAGPVIQVDAIAAVPRVAVDPLGRFGLLWDKPGLRVGALQAFHPESLPLGGRRIVPHSGPDGRVFTKSLAVDGCGGFLATWHDQNVRDERVALFARFFDVEGVPQSKVLELDAGSAATFRALGNAARNRAGDAIATWTSQVAERFLIRARRFGSRGEQVGRAFTVRAGAPGGYVGDSQVAVDDGGRFVVVWRESAPQHPDDRFFFQRFDAQGEKRGARRLLTRNRHLLPQVALGMGPGGEFAVSWTGSEAPDLDRVRARWFDLFGRPLSPEVTVHTSHDGLTWPAVARDRFGNTLILWARLVPDQGPVIEGRAFDRLGNSLGDVFGLGAGIEPSLGFDDDGHFVVAWLDLIPQARPGEARALPRARRFRLTCAPGYEQRCPE